MNLSSSLSLVSQSPLQRDELRKVKTILNLLTQHSDSVQFRQPVDWQGLELLDYTKIIKKPMDLGTVGEKLQSDQYKTIEEVLDDIQLIWDNCKNYNQGGSWIYNTADKMEKYFRKLIKNYFTSIPITTVTSISNKNIETEPTVQTVQPVVKPTRSSARRVEKYDSRMVEEEEESQESQDRKRIVEKIKRLDPESMGQIVEIIMNECPEAFSQKDDKCSIYIHQIDDDLWRQVRQYFYNLQHRKVALFQDLEDRPSKRIKH